MSRAGDRNFALVVFSQVPEFYVTDQNVKCHFTVTAGVDISNWDWIGLYRVGWSKQNQQLCYEWVSVGPAGPNGERNLCIQFPSQSLPKEEGEFYQFVYISSARGTIGCSTPFQFRKPRATDYVEEEFEDMMVVRPKSSVMQEKIQYLENELVLCNQGRAKLESRVMALELEIKARDSMISSLQAELEDSQREAEMVKEIHEHVALELDEKRRTLEDMCLVKEQLWQKHVAAQNSLDEVNSKKQEMEATIKALQSEKDALSGQNQSLVDELASYKDQVTESQSAAASKVKEVAHLTSMLQQMAEKSAASEALLKDLEAASKQKNQDLLQKSEQLAITQATLQSVEEECNTLKNEVQNSQDMLDACQSMKDKMLQDLRAYEQTQSKMNKRVETQESDTRQLQEAMRRKSEECDSLSQVVQGLEKEMKDKDQQLTRAQLQATRAQEDVTTTKTQLQDTAQQVKELEKRMAEMVENCAIQIQSVYSQLDETRQALEQMKLKAAEDGKELKRLSIQNAELVASQKSAEEHIDKQEKEIEGWVSEFESREEKISKYREEITRLIRDVEIKGTSLDEKTRAEQLLQQELSSKDEIIKTIQQDLEKCEQEKAKMRGKLAQRKEKEEATAANKTETKVEEAVSSDPQGSWFALRMASQELRVRLEDKTKELKSLKLERKEWEVEREDCCKEIRDLRERLEMAKVEYTKLMTENNKLLRKLQKHKELRRSSSLNSPPSSQGSLDESCSPALVEEGSQKQHSQKDRAQHTKKMWEMNKELLERNEEKDEQISKLRERLRFLEMKMDEYRETHEAKEATFHDSMASMVALPPTDDLRRTSRSACATDGDESDETNIVCGAEGGATKGVPQVELLYPNPYAQYKPEQPKPEAKERVIYVPTTEEDVTSTLIDPMSSSSLEEDSDLPRPLDPEVMPQAKLAAVKQQIGCGANTSEMDDHLLFEDCVPEMPAVEERFVDAIGESMNICEQCQANVLTSGAFQEHVAAHFGRICPMCKSQADDTMSQDDFEKHVNKCCELATATQEADNA